MRFVKTVVTLSIHLIKPLIKTYQIQGGGWACASFEQFDSIIIDLGQNNKTYIYQYGIDTYNAANYRPTDWNFSGSNDNISWVSLDNVTNNPPDAGATKNYTVRINNTAYRYFKWNISSYTAGGVMLIDEILLYGDRMDTSSTTINYPTEGSTIYSNLSIVATTDYTTNCSINDSKWTNTTTGNLTHYFINNTYIPEGFYSIKIICELSNATVGFNVDYTRLMNYSVRNNLTNDIILDFNLTYLGITYPSLNGNAFFNTSYFLELGNFTIEAPDFYTSNYKNINITVSNRTLFLEPKYYITNTIFNQIKYFNNTNYTRVINFSVDVRCPLGSTTSIDIYLNKTMYSSNNASCIGVNVTRAFTYTHDLEGLFNITIFFNTSNTIFNTFIKNRTLTIDLYPPRINQLNYTIRPTGFGYPLTNISLNCSDNITDIVTYNLTFNGNLFYYNNLTINTLLKNQTQHSNGANILKGSCSDAFSTVSDTFSDSIYYAYIILIDEKNNSYFDVANISGARVYWDDNSSFFDFKIEGNVSIANFTGTTTDKLRFEFTYSDGAVITRYVDISIAPSPLRVCANREGVTHYEQLILSSILRPVILKNVYSNCVVAADFTRFTYQNSLLLKAFTIDSTYYLYTIQNDTAQYFLSSLDGSIATYLNIDNLIFNLQGYNTDLLNQQLTTRLTDTGEITIYYNNMALDNTGLTATITRQDTGEQVFSTSDFTNYNAFSLLFDYSTLLNITNSTLFKIKLDIEKGSSNSILTRYFGITGKSSIFNAGFAVALSVLFVMAGLTWTISRITLSWFGIIIIICAIVILSMATSAWYITFLMVIYFIMLIYCTLIMLVQNYPSLT